MNRFHGKSPMTMTPLSLLLLTLLAVIAKPSFPFSLRYPNPNYDVAHSLFGDAHFVGAGGLGPFIQLNRAAPSSYGILLRSTPIKFNSSSSISSNFTFEVGSGVSLVIIPSDYPSKFTKNSSFRISDENQFFSIDFDRNVCEIASSRVRNVSKINHVFNGRGILSCSIDYHAASKRLDVRLSKFEDPRPVVPLISHRVDLGEMWKGEEVILGLVSSSGNSEQVTTVYSWKSKIQDVPRWLHSYPVNPQGYSSVKKRGCFLSGFVFALSCAALATLALFIVWSYVADWLIIRREPAVASVDFKYEKIDVRVLNNLDAAKK